MAVDHKEAAANIASRLNDVLREATQAGMIVTAKTDKIVGNQRILKVDIQIVSRTNGTKLYDSNVG